MGFAEQVSMVARLPPAERGGSIPTAPLLKSEWEVRLCNFDLAKRLVRRFHYSGGGSNTRVLVCGLWRREQWMDVDCAGVSWWLPPTKTAGGSVCPENPQGCLAWSLCRRRQRTLVAFLFAIRCGSLIAADGRCC